MHTREPLRDQPVERLQWLCGNWKGQYEDDSVEEWWSEPQAGAIMACFRWLKAGEPYLYEFFWIGHEDGVIRMKLRHFGPDFTAWEEKSACMSFVLTDIGPDFAAFRAETGERAQWLTYRRTGSEMVAQFEAEDGPPMVPGVFRYLRA